jgi:hypothetical protein
LPSAKSDRRRNATPKALTVVTWRVTINQEIRARVWASTVDADGEFARRAADGGFEVVG